VLVIALLVLSVFTGVLGVAAVDSDYRVSATSQPGRYGGELRIAVAGTPLTLNPLAVRDSVSARMVACVFDSLVELDISGKHLEPGLATGWETEDDGATWALRLRQGVKWHDGELFSADDVISTLELITGTDLPVPGKDLLMPDGEPPRCEKVDDHTVRIRLSSPVPLLPRALTFPVLPSHHPNGNDCIGGIHDEDMDPRLIVGTGPFQFVSYRPGRELVFMRNPYYWKTDRTGKQLPYLTRIVMTISTSPRLLVRKFAEGYIDAVAVRGGDVLLFRAAGVKGYHLLQGKEEDGSTSLLFFNLQSGSRHATWFGDISFMHALEQSINRKAIVEDVYAGNAVPRYGPGSRPPLVESRRRTDPGRLRSQLQTAGYRYTQRGYLLDRDGNPVAFELLVNGTSKSDVQTAEMIGEQLSGLGVQVNIVCLDFPELTRRILHSSDWDAALSRVILRPGLVAGEDFQAWEDDIYLWSGGNQKTAAIFIATVKPVYAVANHVHNFHPGLFAFMDTLENIWVDE